MAARQYYSVSNAGPVNNTSNATWADVVVLPDFEPDASSTYAFFWSSALQNATNATADAQLRVRFGPAGFEATVATLNLESAATTEYPQLAGMFFHVEGSTPIDVYADVAIKAETNTNSINAKNGQIVALKLGANDVAAESLTRQTTTSTTPADAVSASFTSDGGDYVVVGYGEFDINIGTVPAYMRLRCEGTNTAELGVRTNDATNLSPGMMVWRFTSVAAGSRTAAFQFRAHTSATAGVTNARILVMRAADFDAVYGAQLTSDSASTSSDAVAITFTETLTANPHLLLGGWGTSSTTTSTLITSQVTEAGSDIAESVRRSYNAAQIRFHASGFASLRTPGSGSKTYTLDRVQSGSANIAVGAGSGLALIDLGSSGGGGIVGTSSGSIAFTGSTAGAVLAKGAAAGSIAFTGAATGLASRSIGTASGSLAFTGASDGAVLVKGQGAGTMALSGASAGTVLVKAEVSGSVAFTGSAAGVASSAITGAATGSLAFTGASTGAVAVRGVSTGTFGLAGASTGAIAVQGQGAGSFALSGASAGTAAQPTIVGASSGSIAFTGAVSGKVQIKGVSSASVSFGGSAAGTVSLPGVVGAAAGVMAFNGFAHNRTSNPTGRMWQPFAQSFAA